MLTFPAADGYKVDVSSSELIDHLKCRPLLQHCKALIEPSSYFCSTYSSLNPHQHHHKGVWRAVKRCSCTPGSLFSPMLWSIFLLHPSLFLRINSHLLFCPPFLTFRVTVLFPVLSVFNSPVQACFTFPLILLYVHPSVSFLSPFSISFPHSPPPPCRGCAHCCLLQAKRKIDWASTH